MHWESKKINVTCFIVLFALLLQSGPELEISLTYACVHTHTHTQTHTHTHTHVRACSVTSVVSKYLRPYGL